MRGRSPRSAPRLWLAALVSCALLVGEDPLVIGIRTRFGGTSTTSRLQFDLVLAVVMIAYNFGSTRYVVSIASAPRILEAMDRVDDQRSARIAEIKNPVWRRVRWLGNHLNPFMLIKVIGVRVGRSMDRMSGSARLKRRHRLSSVVGDLGIVNVLGVPGAGLALCTQGIEISRRRTMRHCVLFVGSWFIGAHIVGLLVAGAHAVPVLGSAAIVFTGAIGAGFALLTDMSTPVGALVCTAAAAAVLRYTRAVDRATHADPQHGVHDPS